MADALEEAVAVALAPEEQALPPYAAAIACAAACPAAELMACAAVCALQQLLEDTLWDLACRLTGLCDHTSPTSVSLLCTHATDSV